MRYSPKDYAQALSASLVKLKDKKAIMYNFLKVVRKNNDQKILPKILEVFKEIEVKRGGGSRVKIEFARQVPEGTLKSITKNFSSKDWVEMAVNPSLVAGVRITFDNERELDNSLARKLHKLFN